MAESFVGVYKLEKNENFEKFMEIIGVGLATRKVGANVKNTTEFQCTGNKCKLIQKSTFKNYDVEFELGKEFETTTVDGRKVKTVYTWENGKLVQKEWPLKDMSLETIYERELKADGVMITTCKVKDVVCTRMYKKV